MNDGVRSIIVLFATVLITLMLIVYLHLGFAIVALLTGLFTALDCIHFWAFGLLRQRYSIKVSYNAPWVGAVLLFCLAVWATGSYYPGEAASRAEVLRLFGAFLVSITLGKMVFSAIQQLILEDRWPDRVTEFRLAGSHRASESRAQN